MQMTAAQIRPVEPGNAFQTNTRQRIKPTIFLLLTTFLFTSLSGMPQRNITYSGKKVDIESVFKAVKKQTGYVFLYTRPQIGMAKPVTIHATNMPLTEFLNKLFDEQPLHYFIRGKNIFLKEKMITAPSPVPVQHHPSDTSTVRGRIVYQNNEPAAASIMIKGTAIGTSTLPDGSFMLPGVPSSCILLISGTNIETREYRLHGKMNLGNLIVSPKVLKLDEVVVNMGYYSTSKLTSTGTVGKVSSKEIEKQPVSNPLLAMQGRMPGVQITPASGLAGADVKVEIRGRNFITSGSQPLYVVDGVPFNSQGVTQLGTISGAMLANTNLQSPFNSINPSDIEKIEILKDADATSIYGSRGANGVVLITTKRGYGQKTKLDMNVYAGAGSVAKKLKLLNTEEYLELRRLAFRNDNTQPTPFTAPDLLTWDPSKYTDWQDYFIGGSAELLNAEASVSGGNESTNFLLRTSYRKDGTVFPKDFNMQRGSAFFKVGHTTEKLDISVSASYSHINNHQVSNDPTNHIYFAPNYPIYDDKGKYYWGGNVMNPVAGMNSIKSISNNLVARLLLQYDITKQLTARVSAGYNLINADEVSTIPSTSFNPAMQFKASSYFTNGSNAGYIIEPQLNYETDLGRGRLQVLAGTTFQSNKDKSTRINALDYTDDDMLEVLTAAGDFNGYSKNSLYRYHSVYSRVNYSISNTYIINGTFRRDGSSRFGNNNRFGNFGSIGAGWIFSKENFAADWSPVLSYGKLRGSYGITGSDQINNYEYASTWVATNLSYQGLTGYNPEKFANPDLQWESVKKAELALELGLLGNSIQLTIGHYRNIADNQLLQYPMANITGFSLITKNFDAKVRNSGWEFQVSSVNLTGHNNHFEWRSSLNITFPKNRLMAFDGLENSELRYTYEVGRSLNLVRGFKLLEIDPATGKAIFEDLDKDGFITYEKDRQTIGSIDPTCYGGIHNEFRWKQLSLDFLFQFSVEKSNDYLRNQIVGQMNNHPDYLYTNIWKEKGQPAAIPAAATSFLSPNFAGFRNYLQSDANYTDNSFMRLKNVSLSYTLPKSWISKAKLNLCRIYVNAQNLFTFTSSRALDPEVGWISLPQLKIITAGLQVQL